MDVLKVEEEEGILKCEIVYISFVRVLHKKCNSETSSTRAFASGNVSLVLLILLGNLT
jgi:hypothetical protein